jgi:hypothetical protein
MEKPAFSITPFQDITLEKFMSEERRRETTPVGIIVFDKGKRAVFVGANQTNEIVTSYQETAQIGDPSTIQGADDRVYKLDRFDEILVAQVPLTELKPVSERSILKGQKYSVRFPFRAAESDTDSSAFIEEEEFIDVLTGRKGGVMIFEGANLPEEAGLLIEREVNGKKIGAMFFFHPQQSDGFDSGHGLTTFFRSFSEGMLRTFESQSGRDLVRRFEQAIKINSTIASSELFKAMLIAHILDVSVYGNGQSRSFIKSNFPPKLPFVKDRIDVERAVRNLILTGDTTKKTEKIEREPEKQTELQKLLDSLETDFGKTARTSYEPNWLRDEPVTEAYLNRLLGAVYSDSLLSDDSRIRTESVAKLRDAVILLQEISSRSGLRSYDYSYTENGKQVLLGDRRHKDRRNNPLFTILKGHITEAKRRIFNIETTGNIWES